MSWVGLALEEQPPLLQPVPQLEEMGILFQQKLVMMEISSDNDGCSSTCIVESGYTCDNHSGLSSSTCTPI